MTEFSSVHVLYLLEAAKWTVLLSVIAFAGGAMIGGAVALARTARSGMARAIAIIYVQVVQGTPLIIVLFLFYFGLSLAGYRVDALVAASLSLSLFSGAFLGEIWRGCLQSVPATQWEAADCIGLSRSQQYIHVILPQAMRIATPPTVGFMVQIVKNTSLASVIGFVELSRAGQIVNNSTFEPFIVFLCVAGIYFVLCYPLSAASRYLERSFNAAR
jgi:polar amino acid transport system permease protein